ncbi:MAG: flippase-like domain-containing protein [Nitrospira sp.]|nr:flippase-like domain-containing protein [bacterium]MBL7049565.1 flippase-like domain-containing protein [Nitrospira sp.]
MNKKHVHLIIGLVLIVLSLYYVSRGVVLSELVDALSNINYLYLIPAVMIVALSYVLRAMRWHYLVRGVKNIPARDLFSPLMIGFMGNLLPARAGEFIRAFMLTKKSGMSFTSSFATIFIERLFDLLMLIILMICGIYLLPSGGGDGSAAQDIVAKAKGFGIFSFVLLIFIAVFAGLLQFKNDLAMKIISFFTKPLPLKFQGKVNEMVHSFTEGLNIIRDKSGFIATLLLSVVIWGTFVFGYYPLYFALGIESQLPAISSLVILCLTVAVFITVAPTPGFLGSYHAGCVAALHGVYGIPKATALSFGIVSWIVMMGFTVAVGSIYAVKENVSLGQVAAEKVD